MLDILAVIAPIFMLIGLGYLAVRLALFPQDRLAALGLLVVRFALPALILHSLSSRSPAELLNTPYLAGSLAMLLLVAGALLLFGPLDPRLAMAGVLIAAMPMLSIFPILGQRHDMQGFCAATLLLATTSSFLTISAAIWLLQHYPFFH